MNSLRQRITLLIALTSFLALLVAGIFFVGFDYAKFKESQVNELRTLSEVIGTNSIAAIDFNDPATGAEILSMLRGVPQIDHAALFSSNGELFARYDRDAGASERTFPLHKQPGYKFDGQFLSFQSAIKSTGRNIGYLHLHTDFATQKERWNRYSLILIAVSLFALLVSIILGHKLQNIITKPIADLSNVASKVTSEKDYSIRVEEQGVDELRKLIIAFNDMLERIEERSVERDEAEAKLKDHRDHLEELVNDRTQELQQSNKELEAFSYSVSHDLRAPLRTIHGFCQLLVEDYGDQLDENGLDYLKRTQNSSLKMAELIESLLQLSKISRSEFLPSQNNLSTLVKDSFSKLQEEDETDRDVEIIIEPDIQCNCDASFMTIALDNLVGNAWKYTRKEIKPKIEFGTLPSDSGVKIYFVRDNGVGFEMKYADKIFMAFKRLHADVDFPGTGVGLATVSRIIERHGGKIWAESEPDKGTTFYFTLDREKAIATNVQILNFN